MRCLREIESSEREGAVRASIRSTARIRALVETGERDTRPGARAFTSAVGKPLRVTVSIAEVVQ